MEARVTGSLPVKKTMSMKAQKVVEVRDPHNRDPLLMRPSSGKSRLHITGLPYYTVSFLSQTQGPPRCLPDTITFNYLGCHPGGSRGKWNTVIGKDQRGEMFPKYTKKSLS